MSTEARNNANRKNARKSTGPTSDAGKTASSKNALKHGLTSKDAVLPNEDPAAFQENLQVWNEYYQPRDPAQSAIIERAVVSKWRLDRCTRVESERLSEKVHRADLQYDLDRLNAADHLGRLLIDDPLNRCDAVDVRDPRYDALMKERISNNPTILHRQLQMTSQGVDWLLSRWDELEKMLTLHGFWHHPEKYRAMWLLGKDFNSAIGDPLVQQLFLACDMTHPDTIVDPDGMNTWDECYQAKTFIGGSFNYLHHLDSIRSQAPSDRPAALAVLRAIIDAETSRLRVLKSTRLDPLDAHDRAAAQQLATVDTSPEGILLRRYESACERELHRSISDLIRLRKQPMAETGATPQQNEAIPEDVITKAVASDAPSPPHSAPCAPVVPTPLDAFITLFESLPRTETPPATAL